MKTSGMALRRYAVAAVVAGLLIWLIACGGGGSSVEQLPGSGPETNMPDFTLGVSRTPVDSGRITARLSVADAAELYQLSCRITYDPAVLHPVDCRRGGLVGAEATFFTTLKADGYVPVAFTYHDGAPLPGPDGSLAEIEFEVLDPAAVVELGLITDPEFLIARDAAGADLTIDLGVEQ